MQSPLDVAALAREMKAAQDEARQVPLLTARFPGFDIGAAYDERQGIALPGLEIAFEA